MLGTMLVGRQVIQMRQLCEKCLLAAAWVMEGFHHE
jgi:hypothetical protein